MSMPMGMQDETPKVIVRDVDGNELLVKQSTFHDTEEGTYLIEIIVEVDT